MQPITSIPITHINTLQHTNGTYHRNDHPNYGLSESFLLCRKIYVSHDGKLLVHNAAFINKQIAIPLGQTVVGCGGLDSVSWEVKQPFRQLQHEGYEWRCQFVDDNQRLKSSEDASCVLCVIEATTKVWNCFGDDNIEHFEFLILIYVPLLQVLILFIIIQIYYVQLQLIQLHQQGKLSHHSLPETLRKMNHFIFRTFRITEFYVAIRSDIIFGNEDDTADIALPFTLCIQSKCIITDTAETRFQSFNKLYIALEAEVCVVGPLSTAEKTYEIHENNLDPSDPLSYFYNYSNYDDNISITNTNTNVVSYHTFHSKIYVIEERSILSTEEPQRINGRYNGAECLECDQKQIDNNTLGMVNNNEHTNNTRINKDIFGSINKMNNAVNENINCIDFNSNYIFNLQLIHYVMYY